MLPNSLPPSPTQGTFNYPVDPRGVDSRGVDTHGMHSSSTEVDRPQPEPATAAPANPSGSKWRKKLAGLPFTSSRSSQSQARTDKVRNAVNADLKKSYDDIDSRLKNNQLLETTNFDHASHFSSLMDDYLSKGKKVLAEQRYAFDEITAALMRTDIPISLEYKSAILKNLIKRIPELRFTGKIDEEQDMVLYAIKHIKTATDSLYNRDYFDHYASLLKDMTESVLALHKFRYTSKKLGLSRETHAAFDEGCKTLKTMVDTCSHMLGHSDNKGRIQDTLQFRRSRAKFLEESKEPLTAWMRRGGPDSVGDAWIHSLVTYCPKALRGDPEGPHRSLPDGNAVISARVSPNLSSSTKDNLGTFKDNTSLFMCGIIKNHIKQHGKFPDDREVIDAFFDTPPRDYQQLGILSFRKPAS